MVVSGIRGTAGDLVTLLKGDLTGTNNYLFWVLAIILIGGLGYVESFKPFSRALLVLVLLGLILNDEKKDGSAGLFTSFETAIKSITGEAN